MEMANKSREGIAQCNCPQDYKKTSIKYCTRLPSWHKGSVSSSPRRHWLRLNRLESINLWTITALIVISWISLVSVSDAASLVKSSDNIMSLLLQQKKVKSPIAASTGSEDTEFQQPEINSPLLVAQCRATCLQKFNNRLDENTGKTSTTTTPCFTNTDCFTCWKSCESLASWTSLKRKGDDDKVGSTKKSKSLETMCSHSPRLCLTGCQVSCGFYKNLMMKMNDPMSGPVVATKRENVLHISSGKIEWPQEPRSKNDMELADSLNPQSLVYVLIQQYPDLKWRQIKMTTDTSAEISTRLSNEITVRVLVVSPNGLVTIYYPQQKQQKIQDAYVKKEVVLVEKSEETTTTTTALPTKVGEQPKSDQSSISEPSHEIMAPEEHKTDETKVDDGQDLWELKRVSLIHQKSLVIAELTWNPVKDSDQEYLITWELDGGGLKGHLVTDSTTVSLSLWPDTLYHIQVELFEREEEEEEDGEQDQGDSSTKEPKSKSFSLTVDTSEAIEELEKPSALSKQSSGGHKSVTEFLNVTLLLTISSAALLVLGSLLLALSWHNMVRQRRRCSRDPQLLQDTDDSTNPDQETKHSSYESPTVAIISPAQLVYPSEKVHQELQGKQLHQPQWSATSIPTQSQSHPSSCWWQNLSTRNNHYHINNSTILTTPSSTNAGTRPYLHPSANSSLPGIQK